MIPIWKVPVLNLSSESSFPIDVKH